VSPDRGLRGLHSEVFVERSFNILKHRRPKWLRVVDPKGITRGSLICEGMRIGKIFTCWITVGSGRTSVKRSDTPEGFTLETCVV
jgi:hypothetical protein